MTGSQEAKPWYDGMRPKDAILGVTNLKESETGGNATTTLVVTKVEGRNFFAIDSSTKQVSKYGAEEGVLRKSVVVRKQNGQYSLIALSPEATRDLETLAKRF